MSDATKIMTANTDIGYKYIVIIRVPCFDFVKDNNNSFIKAYYVQGESTTHNPYNAEYSTLFTVATVNACIHIVDIFVATTTYITLYVRHNLSSTFTVTRSSITLNKI